MFERLTFQTYATCTPEHNLQIAETYSSLATEKPAVTFIWRQSVTVSCFGRQQPSANSLTKHGKGKVMFGMVRKAKDAVTWRHAGRK